MSIDKINNIYNLLRLSPQEVYNEVFLMRGITIKNKLSIIANCLNDKRDLDLKGKDPKARHRNIKKAGQSLQELMAKLSIKNNEIS